MSANASRKRPSRGPTMMPTSTRKSARLTRLAYCCLALPTAIRAPAVVTFGEDDSMPQQHPRLRHTATQPRQLSPAASLLPPHGIDTDGSIAAAVVIGDRSFATALLSFLSEGAFFFSREGDERAAIHHAAAAEDGGSSDDAAAEGDERILNVDSNERGGAMPARPSLRIDHGNAELSGDYARRTGDHHGHSITESEHRNDDAIVSSERRLQTKMTTRPKPTVDTTSVTSESELAVAGMEPMVDGMLPAADTTGSVELPTIEEIEPEEPTEEPLWYANYQAVKCVQSCPPTPKNPKCAGNAKWGQHTFETPENCCSKSLSWLTLEACTEDPSSSSDVEGYDGEDATMDALSDAVAEFDVAAGGCPDPYANSVDYSPSDYAAVYTDAPANTQGKLYQCREGAASLYCSAFPPDWSVRSGGIVYDAYGSLGWKYVGECVGDGALLEEELEVLQEELDELEQLVDGIDGNEDGLDTGGAEEGTDGNAASGGSPGFDKPTGGRPIMAPSRPANEPASLGSMQIGSPSINGRPTSGLDGTNGRPQGTELDSSNGSPTGDVDGTNGRPTSELDGTNGRPSGAGLSPPPPPDGQPFVLFTPIISPTKSTGKPKPSNGSGISLADGPNGSVQLVPTKPFKRPTKPLLSTNMVTAQAGQGGSGANDGESLLTSDDGRQCWRSGRLCDDAAEIFACCTACIHGSCI